MKSYKFKLTAIVLIVVIFSSIFFICWNDYDVKDKLLIYPVFENALEDELMLSEVSFQAHYINKSIYLRFDMNYIVLLITIIASYKIFISNILTNEILQFYFYSVFIACFINKKDGKKYIVESHNH